MGNIVDVEIIDTLKRLVNYNKERETDLLNQLRAQLFPAISGPSACEEKQ